MMDIRHGRDMIFWISRKTVADFLGGKKSIEKPPKKE
jgi:hypothetical protein